jgi:hypothetical protein
LDKADNRRVGSQSSRNTGANNSGQSIQKLCTQIQKETCKTSKKVLLGNNLYISF